MSFSFSGWLSSIEAAVGKYEPIVEEAIPVAEGAASIVAAVVPGTAGAIATVETLAPTVVKDVAVGVSGVKALLQNPAVLELESLIAGLVHMAPAGQATVMVPTTTAATVPASK